MRYAISITETLSKTVSVEAESLTDAVRKVDILCRNEVIVLDADDYVCDSRVIEQDEIWQDDVNHVKERY